MATREWTIMIYMAGDNNLAVDNAYAMERIKEVAGTGPDSPNIFVYYDGNSPAIPTLYCDFSNPENPKYVPSYIVPDKLEKVPPKANENAANWRSIVNFVDWCVNKVEVQEGSEVTYGRRANRYALIFSGHSLGFQDIGLFKDESSGRAMKMSDLYGVLQRLVSSQVHLDKEARQYQLEGEYAKAYRTKLLGQKLDILGFDSCVMGMLEVGYQFGYVAKTMIASEGSVPSAGWTYAQLLGSLACGGKGEASAQEVAERFVRRFIKDQDSYTVGGVSVDMAAWDLSRLDEVASAFDYLSALLITCFSDPTHWMYRQMERVILQVHYKCQSYMFDQNIDLGDFCELLDAECGYLIEELGGDETGELQALRKQCRKVVSEIRKAVLVSGFSGGGYQYSNGMSVFFPWSRAGYEASRKNYETLFFAKDAVADRRLYWNAFLKKYLNEVSLRPSAALTIDAVPGAKYRYRSGIPLDGFQPFSTNGSAAAAVKIAGHESSKIAGQEASKIAGMEASKIAGQEASKIAGQEASKIAGHESSKIAGHESSKIAGHESSKIAGHESSKIAGHESSKIAGHESSKIAGHESSKLGGGGSNAFFDDLKLFKNIETKWNISGFTKKAEEEDDH
ncbi:MAG TPA: clostripain-related cysteine peptidase [Pyrinomonadaceae bacterium]|nr:clostripain-related cysteine peptidase [Pyrinomonadaceae bacterium]